MLMLFYGLYANWNDEDDADDADSDSVYRLVLVTTLIMKF